MKCVVSKCGGKPKTKHAHDKEGKDMVSVFIMTNAHTHCANPNNNFLLSTKQKHVPSADVNQEKPSSVVSKTWENISLRETGALPNGHSNICRNNFYLVS